MALNGLYCADVPLSNYSLTHPLPLNMTESYYLFTGHVSGQHQLNNVSQCLNVCNIS